MSKAGAHVNSGHDKMMDGEISYPLGDHLTLLCEISLPSQLVIGSCKDSNTAECDSTDG